jgi:hypothetical protein
MPPKKAASSKGKKGKGKKGGEQDENEAFQHYLDELFFISPQARDQQRLANIRRIEAAFKCFQQDRDGPVEIGHLGDVIRALGFNPSNEQLKILQPMIEDSETGTVIDFSKLEKVMVRVMATKELLYTVTTPDGVQQTKADLLYREPEGAVMEAYDTVWDHFGRKIDAADSVRAIEGEKLRDLLCQKGKFGEQFSEDEGGKFRDAFEDADTGLVREDAFAVLSTE